MKSQLYKHVTTHNGRYTWQLSILGHPCRTSEHFVTAADAALSVDLVKFFLRTEYKLDLPESLDGEQFSSLAYSRRNVDLSDTLSVYSSMPEDVKNFVADYRHELIGHRETSPPESTASKFRRSEMINLPLVRQWVEKLEAAEDDARAFAAIDSSSFFLRLSVVDKSLTAMLKSLRLALRMHVDVTNPRLVARADRLKVIVHHMEQNLDYVEELTAELRAEQAAVEAAVATLEANRPNLA